MILRATLDASFHKPSSRPSPRPFAHPLPAPHSAIILTVLCATKGDLLCRLGARRSPRDVSAGSPLFSCLSSACAVQRLAAWLKTFQRFATLVSCLNSAPVMLQRSTASPNRIAVPAGHRGSPLVTRTMRCVVPARELIVGRLTLPGCYRSVGARVRVKRSIGGHDGVPRALANTLITPRGNFENASLTLLSSSRTRRERFENTSRTLFSSSRRVLSK